MKILRSFLQDESGQAIIEFFLLLLATVVIVSTLKNSLTRLTAKLWQFFGRKIAAACPACDAGADFDLL
jgi:Flp pilus assembly pilin Flp